MHSSAHIQLDDSLWPLLLIRYTGEATNQELQELLDVRTRYLERPEPCVVLHDMSRAKVGTTEQRRIQADWLKRHDAQLRKSVLGVAFVTSSVAMRLILSIILHLKPLSMPQSAFSHLHRGAGLPGGPVATGGDARPGTTAPRALGSVRRAAPPLRGRVSPDCPPRAASGRHDPPARRPGRPSGRRSAPDARTARGWEGPP